MCCIPWGLIEFGHHLETEQPQNTINMLESVLLLMVVGVMMVIVDRIDDGGGGGGDDDDDVW